MLEWAWLSGGIPERLHPLGLAAASARLSAWRPSLMWRFTQV
jgi:hypothetical protein